MKGARIVCFGLFCGALAAGCGSVASKNATDAGAGGAPSGQGGSPGVGGGAGNPGTAGGGGAVVDASQDHAVSDGSQAGAGGGAAVDARPGTGGTAGADAGGATDTSDAAPPPTNEGLLLYRPGQGAISVIRSSGTGTFDSIYNVGDNGSLAPNGVAGFDLLSAADRIVALDYNGDKRPDLFLYRPGGGAAYVGRSNGDGTFTQVYGQSGIIGYDLASTADVALAFDYNGDGKEDLFLYRPGSGAAYVGRSNGDGSFTPVYAQSTGIAGYDLSQPVDRVIAFDYNGDGRSDLFLYRPGGGSAYVGRSNGDGSFSPVYGQVGIAGYDLASTADRVLALDYDGDGKDDLFLYRPGGGAAYVAHSNGDGTFTQVYGQSGIAGYDLQSAADRVLVFDYNGDGKDDLLLYRPGSGAIYVARSNGDGSFSRVYGQNGLAGFDLTSANDRVLSFDYNANGLADLFLYRPGGGLAVVARSNGDGSFTQVYMATSGIGLFDLTSTADMAIAFRYR